jgi:translation initiation factor IF-3
LVKNSGSRKKSNRVYVNRDIRAREVRCILDKDNENIGVISIGKAINMAEEAGLDLIQISPSVNNGVPICRITDYGKYKFELSKKNKERARKQREGAVKQKEIKFRPCTNMNDLQTKARMASKFLADGCRVRICIKFKGREIAHKFIAEERFEEFVSYIETDVSILNEPSMDGKAMIAVLACKVAQQSSKAAS